MDSDFKPQPQMVEGHRIEADGRQWTMTLREGLRFHDGEPVRARDAVASIRRWSNRNSFANALMGIVDELSAPDDRMIVWRLQKRFPMLDLFGRGFTPLLFGTEEADTPPLVEAARGRGAPLMTMPIEHAGAAALYARRFVLVRRDGHVARRGDRCPGAAEAPRIIDVSRGAGVSAEL